MRYLILICCVSMGVGLFAQDQNQVDVQGRKQGPWVKWHESTEEVFYEGQFVDGEPVGSFKYYYSDGKHKANMVYRAEKGLVFNQTFHINGALMAQGRYIDQKKDSVWNYYSKASILSATERWDKGAKEGLEEVFFDKGQVSESTMHADGLRNGPWLQYYEDGKKKVEGNFTQDEFDGLITYYHPNGNKQTTGKYISGLREGTWMYFHENGQVEFQAVYREGMKTKERFENGTFQEYGGDNVILATHTYVNGKKEGPFMEYHDDALFKLVEVNDPRTGERYQKEVKTGNEIKRSGTYKEDLLEGEVKYFNDLGREIKQEQYIAGEQQ